MIHTFDALLTDGGIIFDPFWPSRGRSDRVGFRVIGLAMLLARTPLTMLGSTSTGTCTTTTSITAISSTRG